MIVVQNGNTALGVLLGAGHTSAAAAIASAYRSVNPTAGTYVPGSFYGATNGTTPVAMVPEPSAGTFNVVDFLSYYNSDTGPQTVTFGVGSVILFRAVVNPGERVEYADGKGWSVFSSNGSLKTIAADQALAANQNGVVYLPADVANNTVTLADITGLQFPVTAAQTYWFKFFIRYSSAATATGARWTVNGPAAPTFLTNFVYQTLTATTAYSTTGTALDSGGASGTSVVAGNIALMEGVVRPSSSGNMIGRFASEVASSAITVLAGTFVEYRQLP